jgi:hypothetical protein
MKLSGWTEHVGPAPEREAELLAKWHKEAA